VAASGNEDSRRVAYPARAGQVIAVGATTRTGCKADFSSSGSELDVVAPGGGIDSRPRVAQESSLCDRDRAGDWIYQYTFRNTGTVQRFGMPAGYEGTSMATPHVSGIVALLVGTQKLGPRPTTDAIQHHIQATAVDLGQPGFDSRYGWGLVNAARALRCPPATPC
jgi:serine protease